MEDCVQGYKIVKELGKGAFGKVYKVSKNDIIYAMKIIDTEKFDKSLYPKLMELLNSEKMVMDTLNHKNIIKMYDSFEIGYKNYLILDYCDGGNLSTLIKESKNLDNIKKLNFIYEIVSGINELYINDIMHRDIKLENIFIKDGKCIIGDLGFAKIGFKTTQTSLGTFLYMAPELINNSDEYDFKIDVWAIGILIYYLFLDNFPFYGYSNKEMMHEIESFCKDRKYRNNPDLNQDIKTLLDKVLVINNYKRISISDLKIELERILKIQPSEKFINNTNNNKFNNDLDNNIKPANINNNDPPIQEVNNLLFCDFIQEIFFDIQNRILKEVSEDEKEEEIIKFTYLVIYNYLKSKFIQMETHNDIVNLKQTLENKIKIFQCINIRIIIDKNYISNNRTKILKLSQMQKNDDNYLNILTVCLNKLLTLKNSKSIQIISAKLKALTDKKIMTSIIHNNKWDQLRQIISKI